MKYKMFIDDERFPTTPDWFIARNSYQAIYAVMNWGIPEWIAFDHDLGGEDTAMVFLHKLVNLLDVGSVEFPENFCYSVHSQNPVGKKNIQNFMDNILENYK